MKKTRQQSLHPTIPGVPLAEPGILMLWIQVQVALHQGSKGFLLVAVQASASEGNLSLSSAAAESLAAALFTQAGCSDATTLSQQQFSTALLGRKEPGCIAHPWIFGAGWLGSTTGLLHTLLWLPGRS